MSKEQLHAVLTELQCRSGLFLSVDVDSQVADLGKKVKALEKSDINEENISKFEWVLLPVGLRVVAIRHNATNLYIAMNSSGQIYATEQFGKECKFKENVFENYWCFYSSIEFKNPESGKLYYFGMNKKGNPIRGKKSKKTKPSCHFIPRPKKMVMTKMPSIWDFPAIVDDGKSTFATGRASASALKGEKAEPKMTEAISAGNIA